MNPTGEFHAFGGDPAVAARAWRLSTPWRAASTALVGGGIAPCEWVLNIQVPHGYARLDVAAHVGEVASALGLEGHGVGMLTAAKVERVRTAADAGVRVEATVGLATPVLAAARGAAPDDAAPDVAAPDGTGLVAAPGTINIVAFMPVPHRDGALANLLCTATEAKVQALFEGGMAATGTPSDAVTVLCPQPGTGSDRVSNVEPFGGPRSVYGARLARATCAAIAAGMGEEDP